MIVIVSGEVIELKLFVLRSDTGRPATPTSPTEGAR
jgi:hypothetical protein